VQKEAKTASRKRAHAAQRSDGLGGRARPAGGVPAAPTPAAAAAAAAAAVQRAGRVATVRTESRNGRSGADGYGGDQFLCSRRRRPTGT